MIGKFCCFKRGVFLDFISDNIKIIKENWFEYVKAIIMDSPKNIIKTYINKEIFYFFVYIFTFK